METMTTRTPTCWNIFAEHKIRVYTLNDELRTLKPASTEEAERTKYPETRGDIMLSHQDGDRVIQL